MPPITCGIPALLPDDGRLRSHAIAESSNLPTRRAIFGAGQNGTGHNPSQPGPEFSCRLPAFRNAERANDHRIRVIHFAYFPIAFLPLPNR